MRGIIFIAFLLTGPLSLFAQYDAECFNNTKREIKLAIDELYKRPTDSVHVTDSLYMGKMMRFVDTVFYRYSQDPNPIVKKIIGCRMPDFNFFTISKNEMSVNSITSDFTIISYSSTTYGDVCNARLQQYCRLKKLLKDSLTVINIFEDPDQKVKDYAMNYEDNVEFVANADVLTNLYSLNTGPQIFMLDKYKNIIYVLAGHQYRDTPDEIYGELLDKIREYNCGD